MATIASQNFNALDSSGTFNSDFFPVGSVQQALTNASASSTSDSGINFQALWTDTRGNQGPRATDIGEDGSDFIGVNSFTGGGAPNLAADGTPVSSGVEQNYQFNDTDGRIDLVFDAVDTAGFINRTLNFDYWIASTGYEADDSLSATITDGSTTVNILNLGELELEAQASADDGTANWQTVSFDLDAAGLGDNLTLTISADNNSGSENLFVDKVAFDGDAAIVTVAAEDFDGNTVNLVSGFDPATDNLDGGPGDFFGVGSINDWPQSAGVPFSLADDSVVSVGGGVFAGDVEGIYGQNSDFDNDFFGISDSDEFGSAQTASWTFDIAGFTDLALQVDMGGISDGDSFGGFGPQAAAFTVSIDGGASQTAFALASTTETGGFTFRPMDSGNVTPVGGVLEVTGDNAVTKLLAEDNSEATDTFLNKTPASGAGVGELDTFTTAIEGTGSTLTLTFDTDFPFEAMAFDNIQILGTPLSTPSLSVIVDPSTFAEDDTSTVTVSRPADATTGDLTVALTSSDTTEATVTETITIADGQTSATTTVTGVDDGLFDGDQAVSIVASADGFNNGAASITVTNINTLPTIGIFDIQGAGHDSPLAGQIVVTTGIVTAIASDGFYLQDAMGDGDIATSDAIFVAGSTTGITIGDEVEVAGTVDEVDPAGSGADLDITTLNASSTTTLSTGNSLPAAVIIGASGRQVPTETIEDDNFTSFDPETDGADFFESLEGMLITVEDAVAIAGTNQFGEIFAVANQGANATGISDRGTLNISPDDFNPEKVQIDTDFTVSGFENPGVSTGDTLGDVTGVISYDFGNYQVVPTVDFSANVQSGGLEPDTTALVGSGSQLTVASYNVLNLDPIVEIQSRTNNGEARNVDDDLGDGRFDAIAQQIVNNLATPDIIGLQEVQDNTGGEIVDDITAADVTLQTLVDAIVAAGGPEYEFIDNTFIIDEASGGQPGGNIRTAFLYNPDRVDVVEGSVRPVGSQAPGEAFEGARLPLVADFTFNGETVTVVNNHFSSKGGSAPIVGLEQPFEARQEEVAVNGSLDERQAQSAEIQTFVNDILTADANANVVVLGDLNEFEFVSPVLELETNAGLTNLTNTLPEDERYSFTFQGNSQSLDHILVSDSLVSGAEFDAVHVNSEFVADDQRASDHDPLVARLNLAQVEVPAPSNPELFERIGGLTELSGAEISAFDPASQRLFVASGSTEVQVFDLSDPANPSALTSIDVSGFGSGANSIAVKNGVIAVAVENTVEDAEENELSQPGEVVFFDADGAVLNTVTVGFLPDMVTFTPDGTKVLVANEGEPDDFGDPEGSVSIIDLTNGVAAATVATADFTGFDTAALRADGVRIFPGKTFAEDAEPEYITVSEDSSTAFVALQENNAVVVIDIASATAIEVQPLGLKDYSLAGNELDASDRDGIPGNLTTEPVFGLYQPDAIASFVIDGQTYIISANEGDARDEDERIKDLTLDPTAFPDADLLQEDENLGRLEVSTIDGDTDDDGDFDQLVAYGGRSFTIRDAAGNIVFDSGNQLEAIAFANSEDPEGLDGRSDNKGPEPEGVTVGVIGDRTYAFVGLERANGTAVYDVTNPAAPEFVQYLATSGDISPEGLTFIPAADSPNGENLLVVTNEVSNSLSVYATLEPEPEVFTLELLHAADQEAGAAAIQDAPNFSAVLNALEAEDLGNDGVADNTLKLSSGDAFIPGLFYDASEAVFGSAGIADIQIQNELGFQAIALGNHEFDFGPAELANLIDGSAPGSILGADFTGADFPYLSTNLDFSPNVDTLDDDGNVISGLADLEVAGGQAPQANTVTSSVVIDVNGEAIGVVGATTPTLGSIANPGNIGIAPTPFGANPTPAELDALAAEIQLEVDALLAANPDMNKVVLLSHMQQLDIERALAERLENVDIIVGGGSNTRLFDDNDRPRDGDSDQGQYPEFITNAGGTQTALVNTDGSYKYVGRLVIDFDADGNIIPESYDETVSGAYATDAQGVADLNAEGLVDPEIQTIVDAIEAQIIATEGNVFGVSDVFLNGNRSGIDTPEDTDGVRTQETNLGNLTADANLAEAQAADATVVLSLKNGGGIRASIGQTVVPAGGTEAERLPNEEVVDSEGNLVKPEGGISQNDIQTTLAFNNSLTLLTLTKSEIVGLLEHGVSAIPGVSGRFPQIAGVKFSYDPDLAEGDRILSAGIFDEDDNLIAELVRDGEIVGDVNEEFRMVTLDFLARPRFDDNGDFIGGGDGYSFPNLNDPDVIARVNPVALEQEGVQTGDATFADDGTEQDALAEYLLDNFNTPETAFVEVDTGRNLDERIQNLNFREDTVLPDIFEQVLQIGLFDADTDELIVSLTDGVAIQSSLLAGVDATIAAFVPDGSPFFNEVQSIFLDLNNGEVTQQENVEPYALFGDSNGDFRSGDLALNLGANSISFDLFSENNLGGELLDTVVVDFTVEGSVIPVVEVGLYDAATDELLQVLQDGAIIESSTLPNDLTIAALVLDNSSLAAPVESIAFDFNNGGVNQVENVEPYALFGDSNGDFRGGLDLAPGSNTIELELYSQSRARGQLLDTIAIDFTVV